MAEKTARDIMSPDCTCIGETDTVLDAAERLAELDVGSMPICGQDDRLKGMVSDRDIVVKVIAQGKDPSSTPVSELATQDEVGHDRRRRLRSRRRCARWRRTKSAASR